MYLFTLALGYFLYSLVARTDLIYNFILHNDLFYNTIYHRYALLVCVIIASFGAYYLYRNNAIMLMHGLSALFFMLLAIRLFGNTWFEYESITKTAVLILCLAFYAAEFISRFTGLYFRVKLKHLETAALVFLAVFAALYGTYFIGKSLQRHALFMTDNLDTSWENQALYNLTRTGIPYSSLMAEDNNNLRKITHSGSAKIKINEVENNFGDHTTFIYYLLSPFYRLCPRAEFLLVLQVLIILFSAALFYLLAAKMLGNGFFAAIFAVLFLLHPGIQGLMMVDFHPNTMVIPLVFLCAYFAETGRFRLFLIPYFLLFLVREDIAFYAVFFAVFLTVTGTLSPKRGLILAGSGVILSVIILFIKNAAGFMELTDLGRFYYLFPNTAGVFALFPVNPFFEIIKMMDAEKMEFIILVFAPLLFLSLLDMRLLLLLFPGLFFTIFTRSSFHYILGTSNASLLMLAVFYGCLFVFFNNIKNNSVFVKSFPKLLAAMLITGLFWNYLYGYFYSKSYRTTDAIEKVLGIKPEYKISGELKVFRKMPDSQPDRAGRKLLESVPDVYSVAADENLGPHLSGRMKLFSLANAAGSDYIFTLKSQNYAMVNRELLKKYRIYGESDMIIAYERIGLLNPR